MGQLMLVNPRRRKRHTPVKRKTVAVRRRRASPVRRKRPAARVVRRRRNPAARRLTMQGIINKQLTPAMIAGGGALALDMAWGFMPLPINIKTGPMRYLAKGAGAIGMGVLLSNMIRKDTAEQMSIGALTVIMHDAMREVAQNTMPNIPLGYYNAGMPVGEYVNGGNTMAGLGAYIQDTDANPYLSPSNLSEPFAGPSSAQAVEARMTAECDGHG